MLICGIVHGLPSVHIHVHVHVYLRILNIYAYYSLISYLNPDYSMLPYPAPSADSDCDEMSVEPQNQVPGTVETDDLEVHVSTYV